MKDLIKALQILLKYGNPAYPTSCIHDELIINGIDPASITKEDKAELESLGFRVTVEGEKNEDVYEESKIYSFRYGSA